jgi:hypothetical protein
MAVKFWNFFVSAYIIRIINYFVRKFNRLTDIHRLIYKFSFYNDDNEFRIHIIIRIFDKSKNLSLFILSEVHV